MLEKIGSLPAQRGEYARYLRYLVARRRLGAAAAGIVTEWRKRAGENVLPLRYRTLVEGTAAFETNEEPAPAEITPPESDAGEVLLASCRVVLTAGAFRDSAFEDVEDLFALHRFNWVLPALVSRPTAESLLQLKRQVLAWIAVRGDGRQGAGSDSYSISERLVNWLHLVTACESAGVMSGLERTTIVTSMRRQATRLAARLEYRGEATNNHLINNGRCLYVVGAALGLDALARLGGEILLQETGRQLTPSGFLTEGSSHYQLLACRSYSEALWQAMRGGDRGFARELVDVVRRLSSASAFFLQLREMPLFGDVSPDSPPVVHAGIAAVGERLVGELERGAPTVLADWPVQLSTKPAVSDTRTMRFPDAGAYYWANGRYALYLWVNREGVVGRKSHGHADLGSFVLYWDGRPLLVDPGRVHYRDTALGRYGRSVRSHNAIALDGEEPCVVQGLNGYLQLLEPDYYRRPPEIRVEEGEFTEVSLLIHGFERLVPGAVVTRRFRLSATAVEIEDTIAGAGTRQVETFFQVHPAVRVVMSDAETVTLATGEERVVLLNLSPEGQAWHAVSGAEHPVVGGGYAPVYGRAERSVTLIHRQRARLPLVNAYRIGAFAG